MTKNEVAKYKVRSMEILIQKIIASALKSVAQEIESGLGPVSALEVVAAHLERESRK